MIAFVVFAESSKEALINSLFHSVGVQNTGNLDDRDLEL